jgi:2-octaprenyl-6-methoxyphenol hydroxylase
MAHASMRFDVAISGASFAGLALALGLSNVFGAQIRIAIIDKPAQGAPAGNGDARAFAIWAGSKAVLEALGVWQEIAPAAEAMTAIEISDSALSDGVRATRLAYDATTADGAPVAYMVPSITLQNALRSAVAAATAVTWIAPAEASGLDVGATSARIALVDGREIEAQLVVAAEGRNSKLRDAAGIKTTGWGYAQRGIVATVAFEQPHNGVAIQHFLPGGPFAVLPLKDNRACITWSSSDAEAQRVLVLDDAAFLAELDTRIGGRFGAVTLVGQRQSWPLDLKIARDLTAKRFVLIGDAAHGVHPVAGQGVNLAFRDCAALIEVLADAARIGLDFGDGTALERYGRWRRFDSTMSAAAYDGLNRVFGIDNAVLRAGRGAALGIVDQSPQLKQLIVNEAAGLSGDLPKLMRGERI